MATLNIEPNLARPDDFYELLIGTHRDLTADESALVNCKLVLLLANHIGDPVVLRDALARARADVAGGARSGDGSTDDAADPAVGPAPVTAPPDDPTMPAVPSPS